MWGLKYAVMTYSYKHLGSLLRKFRIILSLERIAPAMGCVIRYMISASNFISECQKNMSSSFQWFDFRHQGQTTILSIYAGHSNSE